MNAWRLLRLRGAAQAVSDASDLRPSTRYQQVWTISDVQREPMAFLCIDPAIPQCRHALSLSVSSRDTASQQCKPLPAYVGVGARVEQVQHVKQPVCARKPASCAYAASAGTMPATTRPSSITCQTETVPESFQLHGLGASCVQRRVTVPQMPADTQQVGTCCRLRHNRCRLRLFTNGGPGTSEAD